MTLFPFLGWAAVITSASLIAMLRANGDLEPRELALLMAWLLLAAYLQFFGSSLAPSTAGLVLQTVLAVYLLIRWKAGG
ncbi:MAG: hypothetical protein H6Q10_3431 [Acidobacteria bacterium]|nr:hypothetical protein [Acidobacteriota bacterium]